MKHILPLRYIFGALLFLAPLTMFGATRTWIGSGSGGAGTDFNSAANWTGSGALLTVDDLIINMTVSGGGDAILSANVTVNSITMTMDVGSGISTARIDANGFTLTVNGAASFEGVQFVSGADWDFCELDAGSAGGGFIFNGASSFQATGSGDFHWEADISNPGSVSFNNNTVLGAWGYTSPGDEPNFIFDAVGTQTIQCDQVTSYTMGESMIFGSVNTPTVNFTNSSWRMHCYENNTTIAANVVVDMAEGGMDNFLGTSGVFTLGAGAEFRIGGTASFPGDELWSDYTTYTISPTSTVEYYGANQAVKGTNVSYGNLQLTGSGTKTSNSNFSVAGDFTNDVTFAHGNDTHTFNGTVAQQINGAAASTTFSTLVVNKSNTLTSTMNLVVDSELQMDAGTFLVDGETITANNQIDLNGGTLQITAGTITQDEDSDTDFDQDGGTFDIDGGTVNIGIAASHSTADYNLDAGTLDISAGTLNVVDELDMDGGTFNVSGTAVVNIKTATGSGAGTAGSKLDISAGAVSITGGTINLLGAFDNTSINPAMDFDPTTCSITGGTIVCSETGSSDEDYFINTNGHALNDLEINKTTSGASTVTIWQEDFEDRTQGDEVDAGATAWSTACTSAATCGLNDGNASDYFQVRDNTGLSGNRLYEGRDMDNEAFWQSEAITITGYTNVSVSVDLGQAGYDNGTDYINAFYSVDGGAQTALTNGSQSGAFANITATASGLSGTTIEIYVYVFNNGGNDRGRFDEVTVTGELSVSATTVFLGDDLDVNGNFNLLNGELDVTASNFNMSVFGNWNNDGAFTHQSGRVTFDGSGNQQLTSGGTTETFYNLTMNNSNATGLTMNDDITIANQLTFTDGVIGAAAAEMVIFNDDATVLTPSDASHVDAPVRKIGDDSFTFPVGNNGEYRSAGISAPGSATDHFTATYFNTDPDASYSRSSIVGTLDHVSACEYWTIDRTNGASDVNVTLSWDAASCGVTDLCELHVARWDGAQWTDHGNGGTNGNTTAGDVVTGSACGTPESVTSFSPFTLSSTTVNNPLPVELIAFDAERNGEVVGLTWITASEQNSRDFIVERSADGINFEAILEQPAAGNSSTILYYNDVDVTPLQGWSYYRLKEVDFDETTSYSEIRSVYFDGNGNGVSLNAWPNPVSGGALQVSLTGLTQQSDVRLQIHDAIGRVCADQQLSAHQDGTIRTTVTVDQNLPSGVYYLTAFSGEFSETKRLIIK